MMGIFEEKHRDSAKAENAAVLSAGGGSLPDEWLAGAFGGKTVVPW